MSEERIKSPSTSDNSFAQKLLFTIQKFKQDKAAFTHRNVINLFMIFQVDTWSKDLSTKFTLRDYLFGAVKLTKNAGLGKYG